MTNNTQNTPQNRRARWLGPLAGMVVGVLAASIAFSYFVRQNQPPPTLQDELKHLEGEPVTDDRLGPLPDPEFILQKAGELGLTEVQKDRIQAVSDATESEVTRLRQEMAMSAADMDSLLNTSRTGDIPKEIKGEAAEDLERATEAYNSLRQKRWEDSVAVLDEGQKKLLDDLRARNWQSTLNRLRLTEEGTR